MIHRLFCQPIFSQIIMDLFPYVRFELLRKKEEEEENQQDLSLSGVTRALQTLHPNAILSRVTTNMLTLATKNILEWFYLNRETDNSN